MIALVLVVVLALGLGSAAYAESETARPWVEIRAVYGGFPMELLQGGRRLKEHGINAVFVGSGAITAELVAKARAEEVRLFAEFNTMHVAAYLKEHPDAAPVGSDGKVCPPPHGWQGVCPTHEGYRRFRMDEFRRLLQQYNLAGVWLDYHHSHASWERADPALPDTCFCDRCVERFSRESGISLPQAPRPEVAQLLLGQQRERWVQWRSDVFTDWVRQFRGILKETRPGALLGSFHCPWSESDLDGALRQKLAIDLRAQAAYLDVFSPMPYHARFGHVGDVAWISRQVAWLGQHLGVAGEPGERHKIWPIVQLSDWGEPVPPAQTESVLDHGSRRPATGVIVFHWSGLRPQREKVDALCRYFTSIQR
jgi:hypothetical protein